MSDIPDLLATDDEGFASSRRSMDPELRAMSALVRTLSEVPEPARKRVVSWLTDRYAQEIAPGK